MTIVDRLIGLGTPPEQAKEIATPTGDFAVTGGISATTTVTATTGLSEGVATGLVAAGTTITDALQLASVINVVATAASGTGVKLWVPLIGTTIIVKNEGANDLKVWPPTSSGQINAITAGSSTTLTTAGKQIGTFKYVALNKWIAYTVTAST